MCKYTNNVNTSIRDKINAILTMLKVLTDMDVDIVMILKMFYMVIKMVHMRYRS